MLTAEKQSTEATDAERAPNLIGKKIGEYEILSLIGTGGMGAVFEGRQPEIGKQVAVKVLREPFSSDAELVRRLLAEARAVNEIRHRGIVDIFSFGHLPEGQNYFVMELLQGRPFDQLIQQRGAYSVFQALLWVEEICEALQAAHASGIIHRDIKPSNLYLVEPPNGRPYVKLLDFGIAKQNKVHDEPLTRPSVVIGTPEYMAPEQARSGEVSPSTDVYALGCVLYEMLTGQPVFNATNPLQIICMHGEMPVKPPRQVDPSLPPEIDELLLWALQKDPLSRPHNAEEFRAACERARSRLNPAFSASALMPVMVPAVVTPLPRPVPVAVSLTPEMVAPTARTPEPVPLIRRKTTRNWRRGALAAAAVVTTLSVSCLSTSPGLNWSELRTYAFERALNAAHVPFGAARLYEKPALQQADLNEVFECHPSLTAAAAALNP